jgi:hypothetical protein
VQIKSHAQKVLKRMETGEDVFRRFEDNALRINRLVQQIQSSTTDSSSGFDLNGDEDAKNLDDEEDNSVQDISGDDLDRQASSATSTTKVNRRYKDTAGCLPQKRRRNQRSSVNTKRSIASQGKQALGETEDILAASALCALAVPASSVSTRTLHSSCQSPISMLSSYPSNGTFSLPTISRHPASYSPTVNHLPCLVVGNNGILPVDDGAIQLIPPGLHPSDEHVINSDFAVDVPIQNQHQNMYLQQQLSMAMSGAFSVRQPDPTASVPPESSYYGDRILSQHQHEPKY